jgi:penicillin-binding protein 1B
MKKRKTSRSKRRRKTRRSGMVRWGKLLLALGVLAIVIIGAYGVYLSKTVRVKFEGQRWALPARVYARPLELYSGSKVNREQLVYELETLGYQRSSAVSSTGHWREDARGVEIMTRAFRFWDCAEPVRHLSIRVDKRGIRGITDAATGTEVALVRFEPLEVGSIHPSHAEDRVLLRRDQIPPLLEQTLLAVEDRSFYDHFGVNPRAILRAVVANVRAGRTVQGGSTLTQQLVKNFFLTPERSLKRKAEEAVMAMVLENRYTKDEILEAYANEIFLGQDGDRAIHGFGLASYFFFNKPVGELRLPEIALLVGMIKGPSYYNPRRHPERAMARRNLVLDVLVEQGVVSAKTAAAAKAASLGLRDGGHRGDAAHPAFLDLVRRQLKRDYREDDLVSEGLQIFTTLDPWVQRQADEALGSRLASLEKQRGLPAGKLEGAVVAVAPQDGEVLAVTGGRDSGYAGFNRALDAVRPIGSLVKPAVYLTALQQPGRYSLATLLEDRAVSLKAGDGSTWMPKNYDGKEHGDVPLHEALARSYNLATVRLGLDVGVDEVIETLRMLGVNQPIDPYPSLFLGALALTPMEVAQLYQTLASGGFRSPLRSIREVLDASGEPLQRYPLTVERARAAAPVYLVNRAMQEVVETGTARYAKQALGPGLRLAGKTGTTDNLRDSWFAGFGGDLVAVVWVGRDDNKPAGLSGSSGALRVWVDLLKGVNPSPLDLAPPESVEEVKVDPDTGLLAAGNCAATPLPFIRGYAPYEFAPCAGQGEGAASRDRNTPGSGGFRDDDGHPTFGGTGKSRGGDSSGGSLGSFLRSIFE